MALLLMGGPHIANYDQLTYQECLWKFFSVLSVK